MTLERDWGSEQRFPHWATPLAGSTGQWPRADVFIMAEIGVGGQSGPGVLVLLLPLCRRHHRWPSGAVGSGQALDSGRGDGDLFCLRDRKPGAHHHYLVVPKRHMGNCLSLKKEHVPLVKKMVEMGKTVLQKNHVTDLNDIRLGFHVPPFSSVPHLHLHVLAPASQMDSRSLRIYGPQSFWFLTVHQLLQKLNSEKDSSIAEAPPSDS
ncbi:hypothetical protein AAFF_G00109770 [Aldrovandia affinis]|uniref:Adenosine 5'-monophosphoramidase HINT3 n=1 Tax=Aldrovandia affinis TaxID=143900 RepID=A0AAD7WB59_9TELE|nr:hypothetical protein AAFF_G00109770 [Aldrovandia affinis]